MIVCTRTYVARVRFGIRVRVRDSGIFEKGGYRCSGTRQLKNYYLYFLYIFTIKIFLKNTLLCLDSPKKKKRIRQVSAFLAVSGMFWPFPAYFGRIGRRPIQPDMDDMAQFWPNQPGLAWIEPRRHESSRVSANPRKKKKKKRKCGPTHGQPHRTPRPASGRVWRGCGTSGATSVLSRQD